MPRLSRIIAALALLVAAATLAAKDTEVPRVVGKIAAEGTTATLSFPSMDLTKSARSAGKMGTAFRFAEPAFPDTTLGVTRGEPTHGEWLEVDAETVMWRAKIDGAGALSLNLAFENFWLPAGATLTVLDDRSTRTLGPYTDADIKSHGELWTSILPGEAAVIELVAPKSRAHAVTLTLRSVQRGFRSPFGNLSKSGSCNVDTVCPEGDAWRDQIRGVVAYSFGGDIACTGTLINNAPASGQQKRPYVLTADHCFRDESGTFLAERQNSLVFYWRYESRSCRAPGSTASGNPIGLDDAIEQRGGRIVANRQGTDFLLLELDDYPPAEADVHYVGWDRSNDSVGSAVSIHHPSGDEKRISFEDDPLTIGNPQGADGEADGYWVVNDWDLGTTEPGSSGSGLFDDSGRLIGQLYGGSAACDNDLEDYYGRLGTSWTGGSPQARLRDWLDPDQSAGQTLNGSDNVCATGDISISASANPVAVDQPVTFEVAVENAAGVTGYAWDFNDDGLTDAVGDTVETHFPSAGAKTVRVSVTDDEACVATAAYGQVVAGPEVELVDVGEPAQICGDGDAVMEPGERWRFPMQLRNSGAATDDLFAVFTPARGSAKALNAPSAGYDVADETDASCRYQALDISDSGEALTIELGDSDDGVATVALGGFGLNVFGERTASVAMSTNGYLSLDINDDGSDWSNDCALPEEPDRGSANGSRLLPLHDDLVIDGLYYQYFDECPRNPDAGGNDACHVFQWQGAGFFANNGPPDGDFDVVAIAYASGDIVYQYQGDNPRGGDSGSIGLQPVGLETAVSYACNDAGSLIDRRAVCLTAPKAERAAVVNETPALALGRMTGGQSTTRDVTIAIDEDATCGNYIALDYRGAVGDRGFSDTGRLQAAVQRLGGDDGVCNNTTSCPAEPPAAVTPENGIFYNPDRPGNGLEVQRVGQFLAQLWYTARPDHKPIWYFNAGRFAANQVLSDLKRFNFGGTFGDDDPDSTVVGESIVTWVGPKRALFFWDFGDGAWGEQYTWFQTDPGATDSDVTRQWYDPAESGWGLVFNRQGDTDIQTMYFYDAAGDPVWLLNPNRYVNGVGVLRSFEDVHCPGCPWTSAQPRDAGSIEFDFDQADSGTVSVDVDLPAPLEGVWVRDDFAIQPIQ